MTFHDATDFELGWMAAEDGKPFRSLKQATIEWRNGYRAFYESVGLKLNPLLFGYSLNATTEKK